MTNKEAIEHAKRELSQINYEMELGLNPSLRKIASNKADWLCRLICMAEQYYKLEERDNAVI